MTAVIIREIIDENDPALVQVKRLFELIYAEMSSQGLIVPLAENGASIWMDSVKKMINRLGILIVAEKDEKVIAFANGIIRFTPDYLGSKKTGSITHIYVCEESRKEKIGNKLVKGLEHCFSDKNVHSVELQVLCNNKIGIDFWKQTGYGQELVQFRKILSNEQQ